jgi:hypothetical protein
MPMHGVITQEKTGSNGLIAKAFGHQPQDFEFPSAQAAGSCYGQGGAAAAAWLVLHRSSIKMEMFGASIFRHRCLCKLAAE